MFDCITEIGNKWHAQGHNYDGFNQYCKVTIIDEFAHQDTSVYKLCPMLIQQFVVIFTPNHTPNTVDMSQLISYFKIMCDNNRY